MGSRLIAFRFEVEMKNGEGDLNFQSMGEEVLRNVVICSLPSCFFLVRPTFVPTGTFIPNYWPVDRDGSKKYRIGQGKIAWEKFVSREHKFSFHC